MTHYYMGERMRRMERPPPRPDDIDISAWCCPNGLDTLRRHPIVRGETLEVECVRHDTVFGRGMALHAACDDGWVAMIEPQRLPAGWGAE